jgi:hypothetical protein
MTVTTLTSLPTAPARTDAPATFISRADAFLAALITFQTEMNTSIGEFNTDFGTVNTNASNAATSESNAATSASNASSSASDASTYASNASTYASNSASSAASAEAAWDQFDDTYLGQKASDPTVDNDGNPLATGAFYFNTTSNVMRVYNGSAWQDVAAIATTITLSQVTDVTATAAEVNYLDITTLGTSEASKAVTADANGVVTFDNGITEEFTTVTSSSGAATIDLQAGTNFAITLSEATTFTFSNAPTGNATAFTLKVVQDASASSYSITWPTLKWPSATAPTLTATASAIDYFVFLYDGSGWYGFTAGQALA